MKMAWGSILGIKNIICNNNKSYEIDTGNEHYALLCSMEYWTLTKNQKDAFLRDLIGGGGGGCKVGF